MPDEAGSRDTRVTRRVARPRARGLDKVRPSLEPPTARVTLIRGAPPYRPPRVAPAGRSLITETPIRVAIALRLHPADTAPVPFAGGPPFPPAPTPVAPIGGPPAAIPRSRDQDQPLLQMEKAKPQHLLERWDLEVRLKER